MTSILSEGKTQREQIIEAQKEHNKKQIVWESVIAFTYVHLSAVYGLYLAVTSAKWTTLFFAVYAILLCTMGVTAGAHRLWSHRSYKAKWPLQLFLVVCDTMALQFSVINWARDHRLHHKYPETDADPHNVKRGFFFAHIGWLMCRKHSDVKIKGKGIDISDLKNNPILAFQDKYYIPLSLFFGIILPTVIPVYCWNESWNNAYHICFVLRNVYTLNITGVINSVAHLYGNKPYDRFINPTESMIGSILTLGEGWHNYHHVFPWDYRTSEFGKFNFTTSFIDFFALFGWAYDLKHVTPDRVKQRVHRTGDGSHYLWNSDGKGQTQD